MDLYLGIFFCLMSNGSTRRIVAGVRSSNAEAAQESISTRLGVHGLGPITCETVLAESHWQQRYPDDRHAIRMSAACCVKDRVSFLEHALVLPGQPIGGPEAPDSPAILTKPFEIEPLRTGDKRDLDELLDPYFKPVEGSAYYALLDAAMVPNLPDMIEASGLEYRCLFKGDASLELRDVAPWLIRLEPETAFARDLFTKGDAPWMLWGRTTMLALRTTHGIDQVASHFRRLTRIRTETDERWLFFRFYDPETLEDLRPLLAEDDARALLGCYQIATLAGSSARLYKLREPPVQGTNLQRSPFLLRANYMEAMASRQKRRFAEDLLRDVQDYARSLSLEEARQLVQVALEFCAGVGLEQKDSIAGYTMLSARYGVDFVLRMATFQPLADPRRSERERKTIIHSALNEI
ncbi:DUF4123 domain-containing protein [Tritonibacter scottomollicae]|nr:DUF4123 domain-containing protein [Tritonibacter scottomollicae]